MSKKDAYSAMALDCMKFVASFNELAVDYEVSANSQTRQLANTRKACEDYKKLKREAEARIVALEAAVKETEDQRQKMDGTFSESEAEKRRLQQEVASLTARLADAARLQDVAVQKEAGRASEKVRREVTAEFASRMRRARDKLRMIKEVPWNELLDLTQVQSNIEFIAVLQGDEPPDLTNELRELREQEEGLSHATEAWTTHMSELEGILRMTDHNGGAPVEPTFVEPGPIRDVIHPAPSSSSSSSDEDSSDSETETGEVEVTQIADGP